jgi:Uma2 family endonuclease
MGRCVLSDGRYARWKECTMLSNMETEVTKRRFTVDEYHRMGKAGIFDPDDRVELIDGEIFQMSPIGHRHSVCVIRANALFVQAFATRAVLSPQNPIRLSNWSEPQPDIVVFKPRADCYARKRPTPADVLFLLEVSDSTLRLDQKIKLPRYAAAGIPELWIADLQHDILHINRDPDAQAYKTVLAFHPGESASSLAFPEITFRVDELLSTDFEEEE